MMRKIAPIVVVILGILAGIYMDNYRQAVQGKSARLNPIHTESSQSLPDLLTITDEDGNRLSLEIDRIPAYKAYLESQDDMKTEIERTQAEVLHLSSQEQYVMLKYNCGNKQCSTTLVKKRAATITSLALADGIVQDYRISPNNNKVLFRYAYNEGGEVVRHVLAAVDLLNMKAIPFELSPLAQEYADQPTWPIVDYQWMDNDGISMDSADLESSEFEIVKSWYDSSALQTKKVEISLNSL